MSTTPPATKIRLIVTQRGMWQRVSHHVITG
jgi:hypothetical protein